MEKKMRNVGNGERKKKEKENTKDRKNDSLKRKTPHITT